MREGEYMTHYRITFEDFAGHSIAGSSFDAEDDNQATLRARALLPAQTSGYEIWRDEGATSGTLVFAEWQLIPISDDK